MEQYYENDRLMTDEDLSACEKTQHWPTKPRSTSTSRKALYRCSLLISLLLNIFLLTGWSISGSSIKSLLDQPKTAYAGLTWSQERVFPFDSKYSNHNLSKSNEAWSAINIDAGSIALHDDTAKKLGLPTGERFPWDPSKSLYFVNGQHQLHCLKEIRKTMVRMKSEGQMPAEENWNHILHCFESLRDDIICLADDTPRVLRAEHPGRVGIGQTRQCRDWNKLVEWETQHSSCWRNIRAGEKGFDTLLRYRYCPEGSPYAQFVKDVFGDDLGLDEPSY